MLFPFGILNNQKFLGFVNNDNDNNESKNSKTSLILKPLPDLALLFNQFNTIPKDNNDPENVIQSKYYDIDEL